ncbi:MAG: alpha/beta hydrolase [Acidisphaera sp.]|nr:alpha/beta hydrolase [Acidisphaera sp.]
MVLLHGASIGVEAYVTFHRQIEPLSRSFRVIAFDQIGFGRTDMPADRRYRNRLERAEHAVAVLDALGVRAACLVGHSEGAFMAARIAVTRPDLVTRLVLMTSGGTAPALGGAADEAWMAASRRAYDYRNFPGDAEAFVAAARRASPAMDEQHAGLLREAYGRALASGQAAMMRDSQSDGPTDYRAYVRLQEDHLLPYLPQMTAPTLLIWANEDATVPVERGLALMRLIPRADMHVLNGSGHALMHDRPETVTRLLAWFCADSRTAHALYTGQEEPDE